MRLGARTLLVPTLLRLGTGSRLARRLRLFVRRLRRAHLGMLMGLDLLVRLDLLTWLDLLVRLGLLMRLDLFTWLRLLMRLQLFARLEALPGALFGPGRRGAHGRRAMAGLRLLMFNLCSLATPKFSRAARGARCFMIMDPGACMGKVSRTLRRQHLGPTAILGSVQLAHTLRMLPVITLLGGQSGVMLTHGNAIMFTGLRAHATPPAVEAHM